MTTRVKPESRKPGRPVYQPTDKERGQVKTLSAMGLTQVEIARVIGISQPTLALHFRAELDMGGPEANAKVAASLFRAATDPHKPNVVAAIFWLKVRAGWNENNGVDPAESLGKKAQAAAAARTAQDGTEWDSLLPGGAPTAH